MRGFVVSSLIAFLAGERMCVPALADPKFADASASLGIDQRYEGAWEHYVGGGVAILDCNGDDRPELYFAGGSSPSRLYLNKTEGPGRPLKFEPVTFPELTEVNGAYPMDVDGDGVLDLVVLRVGENILLRGEGDCKFAPAPADWHFDGGDAWTTAFTATFEQGKQWPTLVFGNYVDRKNPNGPFEACDTNWVLRSEGRAFATAQKLEPGFCALSMLISDWKRNGQPDLRISNDRQYYVFNGREQMLHMDTLKEYTGAEGWPELKFWGMGIASRDITGDGLPEVFLTSMGDQNLMINLGAGKMDFAPFSAGTYAQSPYLGDDGRPSTGWHAEFGDIDNDGRDDLFIAKGNVEQMPSNAMHDPNNLLMQQPNGTFVEKGDVAGIATREKSRGAGLVDLDGDGKLDIVVVNRRAAAEVWQNVSIDTGNWLAVEPKIDSANTHAVGAILEVRTPDGKIQTQEITIGGGHASGRTGPMHFGLGKAAQAELRITWPGGRMSDWADVAINRLVSVNASSSGNGLVLQDR